MTFLNEGQRDRAGRMLGGIALLSLGLAGVASGALEIVLIAAGALALGTGIVGWCPAYSVLGVSTRRAPTGHCPNCEVRH
jgi:Inner membrane protein YgaP-like, transmembrane domain